MIIETLKNYTPDDAEQIRGLLKQLSRSGKDRGEIPKSWFNDLIASPYHDLLIAREEPTEKTAGIVPQNQDSDLENPSPDSSSKGGKIIGVACLSVLMGPIVRKNAFLEDFVTDESVRGQGVGTALWDAMLDWARAKG